MTAADTCPLLQPVVAIEKLHEKFEIIRSGNTSECTREMLAQVFRNFKDPDGNFIEQFQTTGFNQRYFELYLHAYFSRSGFEVDRSHEFPDFLVTRDGIEVAVEATTVNPSRGGVLKEFGREITNLEFEEFSDYARNELAIRYGGPLFSKLKKRYWEHPHCRRKPLVFAIEAFHDPDALSMTDAPLMSYLYGTATSAAFDKTGNMIVRQDSIETHALGSKTIPSSFFGQPDSEHVSAILFANSGTNAKFSRMGYQHGYGSDEVEMMRVGFCYTPDPDAMDSTYFSYNMRDAPVVESWGQGLVVMHNPNCKYPVPRGFFINAVEADVVDGNIVCWNSGWHPFSSMTMSIHLGGVNAFLKANIPPRLPRVHVHPIPLDVFWKQYSPVFKSEEPYVIEDGWFLDETAAFLGIVHRNTNNDAWCYNVLARDENFEFRSILSQSGLGMREEAVKTLQLTIARLLSSRQRLFASDEPLPTAPT